VSKVLSGGAAGRAVQVQKVLQVAVQQLLFLASAARRAVQVQKSVVAVQSLGREGMGQKNKIREMDKLPDFRDDPTIKIKTAISFCMYLQTG
jgi:hypothetical protein